MTYTNEQIITAVTERMANRRNRELTLDKSWYTLCYAVSVTSGKCYVGYNMQDLNMAQAPFHIGSAGTCAENRALHVANTYGESIGNLVFFALNANSEFFKACSTCAGWLWQARGYLTHDNSVWTISTSTNPDLTDTERTILYGAGESVISAASQAYFSNQQFS